MRRAWVTSVALSWVLAEACGDSAHKDVQPGPGSDAAILPDGSTEGGLDGGVDSGSGGDSGSGSGGDSGSGSGGDSGSDGGITATGLLLFSVSPGAVGLSGTGVASAQPHPESSIFGASAPGTGASAGMNQRVVSASALGLLVTDTVDAFSALVPDPASAVYLFSVPNGGVQGIAPTRVQREAASRSDFVGADVFFSDGTKSFRDLGATGDQYGYNGLVASAASLGLSNPITNPSVSTRDDLTGLLALPLGASVSVVYFSVGSASLGLTGSAVAATAANERGCTVFKSPLDGTSSVAFSCAALGLAPGDELDALAVVGTGAPSKILFSVATGATGLAGSGVAAQSGAGSVIYASTGDSAHTNTVLVDHVGLGLASAASELDALAVLDLAPPAANYTTSCTLALDPLSADAGLGTFFSANDLGNGILLLLGSDAGSDVLLAYDAKSCAFLQRKSVASGALTSGAWTLAPLAGWSASTPFDSAEIWKLDGPTLERRDGSGALVNSYAFSSPPTGDTVSLGYDASTQSLLALIDPGDNPTRYTRLSIARPAAGTPDTQLLDFTSVELDHPCAAGAYLGTNGFGVYYFAQPNATGLEARVCPFSASGELVGLPFTWSPNTQGDTYAMGLSSASGAYILHTGNLNGPFTIEHATLSGVNPVLP